MSSSSLPYHGGRNSSSASAFPSPRHDASTST
jgi:hypothetical protein